MTNHESNLASPANGLKMTDLEYSIRIATSDDAGKIAELHRSAWAEAMSKAYPYPADAEHRWNESLIVGRYSVFVAESGNVTMGFLAFNRSEQDVEIADVFIAPQFRRNRIALNLVAKLLEQTFDAANVSLWVAETNDAAKALYRTLGFVENGESKPEPRRIDSAKMLRMLRRCGESKI